MQQKKDTMEKIRHKVEIIKCREEEEKSKGNKGKRLEKKRTIRKPRKGKTRTREAKKTETKY